MHFLPAILFLLALLPIQAGACYCSIQTICQRINEADVIFLAETASVDGQHTILHVVERFRGLPSDVTQVELEAFFTRWCPGPYQPGERTLVILNQGENGGLRDGPCSRSFLVTDDSPQLALVRRFASEGLDTLLQGVIATPGDHSGWDAPVDGAIVEAERDGQTYSTTADAHGHYEFANLPPGDYRMRPRALGYRNIRGATGAALPPNGCVDQELALTATNSLSGVIFNNTKQPIEGVPVTLHHQQIQPDKPVQETTTDSEGGYHFQALPPGSYYILGNPDGPTPSWPYGQVFSPGASDRGAALAVYVGPASQVSGQDVSLGRRHPTRTIEISMTWPDGSPANGHVACRDELSGAAETTVGVAGVARCAALAERPYKVKVSAEADLGRTSVDPWEALVPPSPADTQLQVVLPATEAHPQGRARN